MTYLHYAAGDAWAMTEPGLNALLEIAQQQNASSDVISSQSGNMSGELGNDASDIRQGVAVISVTGPLFRYANVLTLMGYATSYEWLAKDFVQALENPDVKSIVLDIDSPGGEVNGCAEMASLIFDARGNKPIIAYASGSAASGAYWIASACDQIIASETAMLGSIGVVAVYRGNQDESVVEIVSSQSPYKRLDPKSDEGKLKLQSRIDDLANVFIESIAKHRGVDPPTIINDFGGGDVFVGKQAVANGLADQVGSLEKLIQSHANPKNPAQSQGFSFLALEENTMTDTTPKAEASDRQILSMDALKTNHPQLVKAIQAEVTTTASQAATKQGSERERERIGAIISAEVAKGREQLAQHLAFSTDMSAEMALATLNAAPIKVEIATPSAVTGFEQAMSKIQNPVIEPDADEPEGDDAEAIAKRIAGFSQGGAV